ncbi:protein-glutamate methylesterase/protein-glutamine glutaminase [Ectothiorhodospira lacustris]|uniref:protein-glutamate methylesterase/protein-glutamine glutaminase n=1 Tax=Ectothiorhodospira lacustris TaxID=2899127 RepID=UPI001EE92FD8|nr:chemotaxis response regulator protein-glutamate methylesterase [Ectothiorhodospira lacustris]MCG5500939.1 chemotaxis response regulator protein-glutamate methylesterase [Ectothiorhodospira lacustris]MCG5510698.1 chemotaxis response regulator protein-glutamate methylesterase [Ectothiorhodospira lacustris]MCG5522402.1 chemotaxis response regulator protein-glutamate methylesterase [Ectothiorhodospira lacustris]
MMKTIRVMVVDDSATVRQVLSEVLSAAPDIQVIATAADPIFALQKMNREWPDVLVLDIEMPRMDGITFLKKLMIEHPTPVVICSSLTEKGARVSMQAMAAGAVEVVTKPTVGLKQFLMGAGDSLIRSVRAAANARLRKPMVSQGGSQKPPVDAAMPANESAHLYKTTDKVVAIGTSTGGTQALESLLTRLPRTTPGLVVVQHMPEKFTAAFAARLNSLCAIEVREAQDGDRVIPGLALIAPGGFHLALQRSGAQYRVSVIQGPVVNRHRPSVDVLFRSVARCAGGNALGIIMTGMGDDGARGLKEMHEAGALTLAQDEASCVVYGMPREAVKMQAVDRSVSLQALPDEIMEFGRGRVRRS